MLCGDLDRGEDGPLSFGGSKGYSFVSPKNGWINDDDDDGIRYVSVASFDYCCYNFQCIDLFVLRIREENAFRSKLDF